MALKKRCCEYLFTRTDKHLFTHRQPNYLSIKMIVLWVTEIILYHLPTCPGPSLYEEIKKKNMILISISCTTYGDEGSARNTGTVLLSIVSDHYSLAKKICTNKKKFHLILLQNNNHIDF